MADELVRPVGPTKPPNTRAHPWAVASAVDPAYAKFCEYGCSEYYFNRTLEGCKRKCDHMYLAAEREYCLLLYPSRGDCRRCVKGDDAGNPTLSRERHRQSDAIKSKGNDAGNLTPAIRRRREKTPAVRRRKRSSSPPNEHPAGTATT